METLIVGLDAATWSVIEPLLEADELPNFQSILQGGSSGTLDSTRPPMTPLAWTSMATGVQPGRHGIYDFLQQDQSTYQVQTTEYARMTRPTVWDIWNETGTSVGVVNYPMVGPPAPVDPFFISGVPASVTESIAYPDEIQSYIESEYYRVTPNVEPTEGITAYYREVTDLTETQADVVIELLERYDPDICWTVFMGIDWIQHYLWDDEIEGRDAVDAFYIFMDSILGKLLAATPNDCTVVVVSDHGARQIEGEIHANSLLEEMEYLSRVETDPSAFDQAKLFGREVAWTLGQRLPERIKSFVKRSLSEDTLTNVRAAAGVGQFNLHETVQWDETVAFSYGYMGRIFINRTDRYPNGVVTPEKYDQIVTKLINELEALTHPTTGKQVVDRAIRRDEVYSGPETERAPDILVIPRDWRYMIYGDFDRSWIHEPELRIADHDPTGIFFANGSNIRSNTDVEIKTSDIAPTLLPPHGAPILDDMDGEVRTDIFTEEYREKVNIKTVSASRFNIEREDRQNKSEVPKDQLEDLGYL